ncbi:AfsR/SARP family transcriptional regulator [Amycolatopsis nigrescens]|uniref:AfsR/SARP family transcriptional regulator n=1 Tax=Amycolatopsis nigrescens TaxID=381445 RepID=UPI0003A60F25|nr:AfsR/SARP family transcriptional regulator [Amycolatopsis nigrescens]
MAAQFEFKILGPLEVEHAGRTVELGGLRPRILLTMLLLEANHPVPFTRLIDAIWGDAPPASARTQVRICVSTLRRRLVLEGMPCPIETHHVGYLLRVPAASSDFGRFRELVRRGRAAADRNRHGDAVELLRAALGLWRGPVAAGLDSELVRTLSTKLAEEQLTVLEERFELELRLGLHRLVVGDLAGSVAEHPFRERLCAQLMLALYRSGRQAEALDVFRVTRRRFDAELGIEPGGELRTLEQAILRGEPGLAKPDSPGPAAPDRTHRPGPDLVRLRQVESENARLRSDLAMFREAVTSWLEVQR